MFPPPRAVRPAHDGWALTRGPPFVSAYSHATVIPDAGTVYFGHFDMSGDWGKLVAEKGVLVATDGRSRRVPAPARRDDTTISGDGWTFKAAPGWLIREGARRGDYEVVRQQR